MDSRLCKQKFRISKYTFESTLEIKRNKKKNKKKNIAIYISEFIFFIFSPDSFMGGGVFNARKELKVKSNYIYLFQKIAETFKAEENSSHPVFLFIFLFF